METKKTKGRNKLYGEETMVMSIRIPKKHHERLKTIVQYELDKLKVDKKVKCNCGNELSDKEIYHNHCLKCGNEVISLMELKIVL